MGLAMRRYWYIPQGENPAPPVGYGLRVFHIQIRRLAIAIRFFNGFDVF